eukprot:m.636609 g.636609  ORF g.636609 m.636609 type:complete len:464 (+) comp58311_c0_seq7:4551-5942(+)
MSGEAVSPNRARGVSPGRKPEDVAEGFGAHPEESEMDVWMAKIARTVNDSFERQLRMEANPSYQRSTLFGFTDFAPFVRSATQCFVADSFTACFESKPRERWNFNIYLFILWFLGVVLRYCVLFPIRFAIVLIGFLGMIVLFLLGLAFKEPTRSMINGWSVAWLAKSFLISWCTVLREHGTPPCREPGQIYVANHTTVCDVVLLLSRAPFSLTGQAQPGLLGFFQNQVLSSMENLWFDRLVSRDRALVAQKIREHAADVTKPPLLVFPEGTCVNNEYIVMFKRGAFDIGTSIVPIAIKYNKIFVDAFWNSRKQSFAQHLLSLMTSWALVVDVYYMEPQYRQQDESVIAFATRVKELIAKQANLIPTPWDGYLKYFKPKPEMKAQEQKEYAQLLLQRFGPSIERWKAAKEQARLRSQSQNSAGEVDTLSLLPPTSPRRTKSRNSSQEGVRRRGVSESELLAPPS